MKGLQGMVRSLIGTVADQHDNTQKLQEQLEQGKTSFFHLINPHHSPVFPVFHLMRLISSSFD